MEPSKYQKAIYKWIQKEKGNAIIQAVAGSGKTTTIIEASKLLPTDKSCIFLAFNKAIANELKTRLPTNVRANTLHSLGLSMFEGNTNTRPKVEFGKLESVILKVFYNNNIVEGEDRYKTLFNFLKRIVPLIKSTLINHKNYGELYDLIERFNIDIDLTDEHIRLIDQVLTKCKTDITIIDFDDMIWIPIVNNFKANSYDWVLVDEAQDLNKSQFELIKKICNDNTRIIAVGDRQQSIYAFRGADTFSMDNFKSYFKAKELPLSICYRCPKSHIEIAKTIVPIIESKKDAKEGLVQDLVIDELVSKAVDKDLILCRTNAPLVDVAFNLIRNGKKAVIRGRDIGRNLITMINKYKVSNLEDLIDRISSLQRLQEEKIRLIEKGEMDKRKKSSFMQIIDSCETILVLTEQVQTIQELKDKIENIFTDDVYGIVCSSIHKAKGLEADNVFIINYDKMPHPMAKTDEEIEQEMNIKYVALTRSKNNLYMLYSEE